MKKMSIFITDGLSLIDFLLANEVKRERVDCIIVKPLIKKILGRN